VEEALFYRIKQNFLKIKIKIEVELLPSMDQLAVRHTVVSTNLTS
jgi:hypothetical protein